MVLDLLLADLKARFSFSRFSSTVLRSASVALRTTGRRGDQLHLVDEPVALHALAELHPRLVSMMTRSPGGHGEAVGVEIVCFSALF